MRLVVDQYDHAAQPRCRAQDAKFMQATFVFGNEVAQVHQDDIADPDQLGKRFLPGRVVAVTLIDPVTSFNIRLPFKGGQAMRDISRAMDETFAETAVDEGEDVISVDGAFEQIGAGDQYGIAG